MEMIAAMDQAMAASVQMAALMATYRKNLRDQGFSDKDAMQLVIEFQRAMLTQKVS
jgi:hypothetical protein